MTALRGIAACLIIALVAVPARAQTGASQRPYRALFGGDPSNQRSLHQLALTVSAKGGLDNGMGERVDVAPADSLEPAPSTFSEIFLADAALSYAMLGSRVKLGATGSASFPYYSVFPETQHLAYGTGANVGYTYGPTSLSVSGSFAYSPYYTPALDPASGYWGGLPDYASAVSPNETASVAASWTRRFGRETSVSAGYTFSGLVFVDEDWSNHNQNARVSASRQVSRSLFVNGGYVYTEADYNSASVVGSSSRSHNVNVGFGYTRRSPRGQGMTLAGTVGVSTVDYQQRQDVGWNGSANASQPIGANWSAGASYSHSLQDQGMLQEPVWSDVVGATLGGRLGRRVTLSFGAAYWTGNQFAPSGPRFDSYSGTARAQVALTEFVAITADYTYYRYNYPAGFELPAGVPRQQDRQRVLVGASCWLPLVRAGRARVPLSAVSQ